MDDLMARPGQLVLPAVALAGALEHLTQHLESACPRSAYLATLLFSRLYAEIAADSPVGPPLRQLIEVLECDPRHSPIDQCLRAGAPAREARR
jgi:hypothetical protein